jgi:hypothetical protein
MAVWLARRATRGNKELLPATAAFAVPGLLADQGGKHDDRSGGDFQENMRRRRASLRSGPVVYEQGADVLAAVVVGHAGIGERRPKRRPSFACYQEGPFQSRIDAGWRVLTGTR